MRELSVQSANDTNTLKDRESIQQEVDALVDELDRIATKTTFNNQNILDGSFTGAKFHIGANSRENLSVSIKDARSDALGRMARYGSESDITVSGAGDAIADEDVVLNGVTVRSTVAADDTLSTTLNAASAIAKAAAINDSTEFTGVKATVESTVIVATADIAAVTMDSTNNIAINGETLTGFRVQDNDADDTLVNQINAVADKTGVVASLDQDNRLVLTADENIEVSVVGNGTQTGLAAAGTSVTGGRITLQSKINSCCQGIISTSLVMWVVLEPRSLVNSQDAVSSVDVTTREGANRAIEPDVAIGQVSSIRSEPRCCSEQIVFNNQELGSQFGELERFKEPYQDADFAKAAHFSRNKIVQQAGVSVLAQANQQPNIALSLIG